MNILHLNSESSWRGGEQQLSYLLKGLKDNLSHNIIVMGKKDTPLEQWCESEGIHFIPASFNGSADLITAWKIKRVCKEFAIHVMHAHTSHSHAAALYSKLFLNEATLILHRRVSFPIKNNFISRFKYRSKFVSSIICISGDVRRVLTDKGVEPKKTVIINDAVDPERFKNNTEYKESFRARWGLPDSKIIVSNTSALSSEKDYSTFINTAEQCIKDGLDAIFLIIGQGAQKEEIAERIKEKRLEKQIFMLGFVKDISDVFRNTDLLLITSKQEGLGSSILDAFITKTPVIATAVGGIPELITHLETGMLANRGNHAQLASHIKQVTDDSVLYDLLKTKAYSKVTEQFLCDTMVRKTDLIYQQTTS